MLGLHNGRRRHNKLKNFVHVVLALGLVLWLFHLFSTYTDAVESEIDAPQPTIGKVTMIYGNNSIYEMAVQTHEEHSRRLGYPLLVLRNPVLEGVWNKYIALLTTLLEELEKPRDQRLEWLFWFDSDTVLMNPNLPLETFLPPSRFQDVHMLLTKDWNGMNNGVFFIRVHPWSVKLLSAAISYPIVNPDVYLYWPDQSALTNLLNGNDYFARSVAYCPLRWFNAYMRSPDGKSLNPDSPAIYQVHPGDLLVHFPGTPPDKLNDTVGPYLAITDQHQQGWELPLEGTGYIRETDVFWNRIYNPPGMREYSSLHQ